MMSDLVLAPRTDIDRARILPFKRQVDRSSPSRPRAMNDSSRNGEQVAFAKQDLAVFQLDNEFALNHEEDLVGLGMPMPFKAGGHHAQADFVVIGDRQPAVAISLGDGSAFIQGIGRLERRPGHFCHRPMMRAAVGPTPIESRSAAINTAYARQAVNALSGREMCAAIRNRSQT